MITFESVPTNARASGVFVEEKNVVRGFANLIAPQIILVIGQFNSGKSPTVNVAQRILSKEDAWDRYGRGSLLARMIEKVFKGNKFQTDVYALPIAENVAGVVAEGSITVTGTSTEAGMLAIALGDRIIELAVAKDATGAAVTAALETAVNADLDCLLTSDFDTPDLILSARHKGAFGNEIGITLNPRSTDKTPAGLTVTIVDMASGAGNPVLTTGLAGLGDRFYTVIVNPYSDSTSTAAINTTGDERIAPSIKKPFLSFTGIKGDRAAYLSALGSLNSKWICTVPTFNIPTPSFELAAETAGIWARVQLSTPNRPVKEVAVSGALASLGFTNLTYEQKNDLVLAGGSWFKVLEDGSIVLGDLCTTRTTNTSGGLDEDWRFSEVIANLQTKIYSLDQLFNSERYLQSIVVDDASISNLSYVVRPRTVRQDIIQLIDELWIPFGLSKQRDDIVKNIVTGINSSNPARIDVSVPDIMAAQLRIVAARFEWAFVGGNN